MDTKGLDYYVTRIEKHQVAIGSSRQTMEDVKALHDAIDVAINRALGGLPAHGIERPSLHVDRQNDPCSTDRSLYEPHALGDIGLRMHPRAPHEKIPLSTDVKV